SPILNWLIVLVGGTYLIRYFMQAGEPLSAINLNIVNLTFLLLGFLLHKTPARLMHAVQGATPAVWGVILQFPFYAGIAGIITSTHLNKRIADAFVGISSAQTFPAIVATYSAVLGVFVPSGGWKGVWERPPVWACSFRPGDRNGSSKRRTSWPPRTSSKFTWAGSWQPTIWAKRWRISCSRSGCCRSWDCFTSARATSWATPSSFFSCSSPSYSCS